MDIGQDFKAYFEEERFLARLALGCKSREAENGDYACKTDFQPVMSCKSKTAKNL
jgi:hypothetical protein